MKRRRVEKAVLIWPKESKKLEQEDEEIQHGSKIKNFISSLPNFAAGLAIITTLSAILSNLLISIYDRGYSHYFGISDELASDRMSFLFVLLILLIILILLNKIGDLLSLFFTDFTNFFIGILGTYVGCLIFTSSLFSLIDLNTKSYNVYTYTFIEFISIITFAIYHTFFDDLAIFDNVFNFFNYDRITKIFKFLRYVNKCILNKISLFFIYVIYVILCCVLSIPFIYAMYICVNMFSEMGFSYAQVEANYKIVSYENETDASYLLLENTDHQYILMEVEEVPCEDAKICYKGTRGKYQYIDDKTNLQIQETHCKIMFDEE